MRRRRTKSLLSLLLALSPLAQAWAGPPSPIAHWRFDETTGTTASDSAGSFDGTLAGGAHFVPGEGVDGGAIRLDEATQSLVNMGNVLGLTGASGFSIAAWFRTRQPGTATQFIVGKHQSGHLNGFILGANRASPGITNAVGRAWLYVSSPNNSVPVSTTVVANSEWHHVVGVYTPPAGQFRVYVDGGPGESTVASHTLVANSVPFLVGGIHVAAPASVFTGDIDDVQVYDVALTDEQVQALWRSYSFVFADGFETGATDAWSTASP